MNKDKKSTLPSILSIIALAVSILSFSYNIWKDAYKEIEQLSISYSDFGFDTELRIGNLGDRGTVSGHNFGVILSNNSKIPISITSYNLYEIVQGRAEYYSNLVNGIFLSSVENEPIHFPIDIDAGKSIYIRLNLCAQIPKDVLLLIQNNYKGTDIINTKALREFLASNGLDLYGNETIINTYNGLTDIDSNFNSFPHYSLEITTSKGKTFSFELNQVLYSN